MRSFENGESVLVGGIARAIRAVGQVLGVELICAWSSERSVSR